MSDIFDEILALADVAACDEAEEEKEREKASARKRRRIWTKEWLLDKQKYSNMELLEKLRQTEPVDFKNYLRMDDATFQELLQKVTPLIKKQDTVMRPAISPEARLTVTLRYLATGNTFEDLKFSSAISPQAIGEIVIETCEAIAKVLKDFIKIPQTAAEWKAVSDKFENKTDFPHCLGCIDGKHVTILKPQHSGSYYFNYKKTFSIVLMAVVNSDADFLMVDVGTNGRVSDGGVFSRTKFFEKLSEDKLDVPVPEEYGAERLPFVFLGDDAFPLRPDLLKPYKQEKLTPEQEAFNHALSRARVKVEQSFGIMSARFRVLLTTILLCPEKATKIVLACCFLHNYLRRARGKHYTTLDSNDPERSLLPLERSMSRNSTNEAKLVRNKFCKAITG